jgi:tyrosyl-tRNA synthetase
VNDAERKAEVERQLALVRRDTEAFVGEEELAERLGRSLAEGRPLRIKLGMDPSAPDLHLGHTVVLHKLALFQDLGHTAILLVGDFTARIGDPSGRKKTRPALSPEEVRRNAATYVEQAGRVLDVERAEIRYNGEWMDEMRPGDFVRLCSTFTVARLLEREDFAARLEAGAPISVHEFLYPFVQAYDSVALRADVELGGTDQTFNLLTAREIQRHYGQPPQAVLTHALLVGTDGREKMSKSLGNAVGISEPPAEIYGKVMSISDRLMLDWLEILSFGEWQDLMPQRDAVAARGGDPMALKQALARRLVARCHGAAAAGEAEAHFRRVVQGGQVPREVPERRLALREEGDVGLLDLLRRVGLTRSNGEGRRLVEQGGLRLEGELVSDPARRLGPGTYLIQAGKRRFLRVAVEVRAYPSGGGRTPPRS